MSLQQLQTNVCRKQWACSERADNFVICQTFLKLAISRQDKSDIIISEHTLWELDHLSQQTSYRRSTEGLQWPRLTDDRRLDRTRWREQYRPSPDDSPSSYRTYHTVHNQSLHSLFSALITSQSMDGRLHWLDGRLVWVIGGRPASPLVPSLKATVFSRQNLRATWACGSSSVRDEYGEQGRGKRSNTRWSELCSYDHKKLSWRRSGGSCVCKRNIYRMPRSKLLGEVRSINEATRRLKFTLSLKSFDQARERSGCAWAASSCQIRVEGHC